MEKENGFIQNYDLKDSSNNNNNSKNSDIQNSDNSNNNTSNPFLNLENNFRQSNIQLSNSFNENLYNNVKINQSNNTISFPSPSFASSNITNNIINNITYDNNISRNINNPYVFNNKLNTENILESSYTKYKNNSYPSSEIYLENNSNINNSSKSISTNDINFSNSNANLFNNIEINYNKNENVLLNLNLNNTKQDSFTVKLTSSPYTINNIRNENQQDETTEISSLVNKSLKNADDSRAVLYTDHINKQALNKDLGSNTSIIVTNSENKIISKNYYNSNDKEYINNLDKKSFPDNDLDSSPSKQFYKRISLSKPLNLNIEQNINNNEQNIKKKIDSNYMEDDKNNKLLINLTNLENEKKEINILGTINDYSYAGRSTNPFEYNKQFIDRNNNNSQGIENDNNNFGDKENYKGNYNNNNNNNNCNSNDINNNTNDNNDNNITFKDNKNNKNNKNKKTIKNSDRYYEKMEDDETEFNKNSLNDKNNNSNIQNSTVSPIKNNVIYPSDRKGSVGSDIIRYTNPFVSLNNNSYLGGGSFAGDKFTINKSDQNIFNPQGGFLNYKINNLDTNYLNKANNLSPINTNINDLSSLTTKNYEIINQLTVMSTDSMSSSDMLCSDSPFYESDYSNLQTAKLLESNSKENLKDILENNVVEDNKYNSTNYEHLKIEECNNIMENETPTTNNSSINSDIGNNIQEEDNNGSDSQTDLNTSKINLNGINKRKPKRKSKHYSYSSRKSGIDLNMNSSIYKNSNNSSLLHKTFKGIKKVICCCFCCQCCLPSDNDSYYGSSVIKVNDGPLKIDKNHNYPEIECEILEDGRQNDNKHLINSYERLNENNEYISISPTKKYLKKTKRTDSGTGFTFTKRKNYNFKFFKRHNKKINYKQQQMIMTPSKLNNTLMNENNSTLTTVSATNSSSVVDNNKVNDNNNSNYGNNNSNKNININLNDNKNILDNPTTSNNSHNLNNNSTITSSITMGQESIFSKKISNMFSTSPFKGFSLTEEEKINKKKLKEKKGRKKKKTHRERNERSGKKIFERGKT